MNSTDSTRELMVASLKALGMDIRAQSREMPVGDGDKVTHVRILVGERDVTGYLEIKKEFSEVSKWRSEPTGRYLIKLTGTDYKTVSIFKPVKTGGYNWTRLKEQLEAVIAQAQRQEDQRQAEAKNRMVNAEAIEALRDVNGRMYVYPHASEGKVEVRLSASVVLTLENATRLHALLKELQIVS